MAVLSTCFLICVGVGSVNAGTTEPGAPFENTPKAKYSPDEAGLRYGQALGSARVCYGLRTTKAAEELARTYQGSEGEIFHAKADKIIVSWEAALSCTKAGGPNECRLIYEMSCRDAYREIGPEGSRLPGLVERVK